MDHDEHHEKQDPVLELNFVPQWARKAPGENPYLHDDRPGRGRDRRPPARGARRDRRSSGPRRPQERTRPRSDRSRGRDDSDRSSRKPQRERQDRGRPEPRREEHLPLDIRFLPEKLRIGAVVRQLHATARAYPLREIASLFLGKPQYHLIKLEVQKEHAGKNGFRLYQCKACGMVFLDKRSVISHALSEHLADYYVKEEQETDPPAGNFVCVGRCRKSGQLIAPPNYHGFNEKVREIHESRFSFMSLDEYRRQIEMVRDPELIEQWKQQYCKKTVYRILQQEGASEKVLSWSEVEAHFLEHHAEAMVQERSRVVLDAEVSRNLPPGVLRRMVRDAWVREEQYPLTLSLALRPAFRHMHLHLFRAGKGTTFVTPIRPQPIDRAHTVAAIGEVLSYLAEHPGCSRHNLAKGLRPEATSDSADVATVLNPLRWLIERGHVIEFFDGTLALPRKGTQVWGAKERSPKNRQRKGKSKERREAS